MGGADTHPWFRDQHAWVAGLLPRCEVHLVPGAGHALVQTHTDTVAHLLADFMDRVSASN